MINQSIQLMDGKKGGCSSSHMMLGVEGRIGCCWWVCTTFFFRQGSGRGFAGGNGVCTTLKRRERLVGKTVSGVELRAWCSAGTMPAKGGGLTIGGLETGWGKSDRR